MKVIFKIIIFIFVFMFFINYIISFNFNKIYASTKGNVYLSSNKQEVNIGQKIEISINIEGFNTSAYDFELYFDNDKLDFLENDNDKDNINLINNKINYIWFDRSGNDEVTGNIKTFRFKAKKEGVVTFTINGNFYTKKAQEVDISFNNLQVNIIDTNNNNKSILKKQAEEEIGESKDTSNSKLENLRLNIEGLVPEFNKDVFDYYLTVNNNINNLEILTVLENKNSKIEVTGNENLKEGLNIIKVQITSEDNSSSTSYIINVTKTNNIEDANTNLETLAIQNYLLYPNFDNTVTNYNVEVANDTDNINLLAIPEEEEAKVEIDKNDKLQEGNNTIKITVTAKNNYTKKVYNINVYRRNENEEKEYKLEQEENKELLNNIQRTSTSKEDNNNQKQTEEQDKDIYLIITLIILLIILIFTVIFFKIRRSKKKQKTEKNI